MPYGSSSAPRTESFQAAAAAAAATTSTAGRSQGQAPLLPPIHHFEPHHQAMQSQPPPPIYAAPPLMSNGAPMQNHHPPHFPPPPPQQYPPYQNGAMPAPPQMPTVADAQNGAPMMRYPIPPQASMDARAINAGRHKKEIKRRTKTGCLTCRKRRIKCDEGLPHCRNCAKSKRECMGYDPIFKQQPAPANIRTQPAPPPPLPQQQQQQSQPSPVQPSQSSQHHHAVVQPGAHYDPYRYPPNPFPGSTGHLGPGEPRYNDHGGSVSLDPALAASDHAAHMAHNNYPALQPQRRVKRLQMEELFAVNDVPPRFQRREAPPRISNATQSDVEAFYKYHYAVGLDQLFETTWYSSRGLFQLQRDHYLQDFVAQCAEQFRAKKNDEATNRPLLSLETRLVWSLAQMPRALATTVNGAGADQLVAELLPRLDIVENLLTGQFLDSSRVPSPSQHSGHDPNQDPNQANRKHDERAFWHHLGRFTSIRDDSPAAMKDVSDALLHIRSILAMQENRDVLYSIAIARHIGGRMAEFHPQRHILASTNDPNDDVNKLKVAQQFVEGEDQRGTTQVIQRICSMAMRGWLLQKQ